ncbi:hypothetical protein [Geodermatophilus sp. SYSU D00079]
MSVLPFPSVADRHEPWPSDRIATLSDRAMLARAAEVLGLPTGRLPLPLSWGPGPQQFAVLRAAAELLLARLERIPRACMQCDSTDQSFDCARELGRLEARLSNLAHEARLILS